VPAGQRAGSWSRQADALDWLLVLATIGLSVATLWVTSVPFPSLFGSYPLPFLWPLVGASWSLVLLRRAHDGAARFAAALLLLGAVATTGGGLPFFAYFMYGETPLLIALLIALGLLAVVLVRERPLRIVWLVAPAIVLAMIGVGLSGAPAALRFAYAKPALTSYAESVLRGEAVQRPSEQQRITVGSIDIAEVHARRGCVHLTTAYLGFDDDPAGIAYCPSGPPSTGDRYEQLNVPWYRWLS
jgi:hypothetical protein